MKSAISVLEKHYEKIIVSTDQALVSGSNFLTGILISKILGLEELGVYAFAWMTVMMCSSLQQNFISIPMVNKYIELKQKTKTDYLMNLFLLQGVVSVLFAGIVCLLLFLPLHVSFFSTLSNYRYVLPLFIMGYLMQDFTRRTLLLQGDLLKLLLGDFIVNWGQVGFLVVFLQARSLNLTSLFLFFSLTYWIGFLIGLQGYFNGKISFPALKHIVNQHWTKAKWLLAAAILQWFAGNYFIVSADSLLGTESAGIIRIAQSIVGILNIFFIALEFYIPPKAAVLYTTFGKERLIKYCIRLLILGVIICLSFTGLLVLMSDTLLGLIYGYQYEQYSPVVIVFSVFYTIVFLGYPMRFVLRAMDKMKDMFWAYFLATVFSIVTAEYIVGQYGIWGVIAGLALTQIIMQIWYIKAIVNSGPNLKEL